MVRADLRSRLDALADEALRRGIVAGQDNTNRNRVCLTVAEPGHGGLAPSSASGFGCHFPGAVTVDSSGSEDWPLPDENRGKSERRGQHAALRYSLAGVQLKFFAAERVRGGFTIPARGIGGSWVVKLPSLEFEGVPENEFAMPSPARMIGMDVPAVQLIDPESIAGLPQETGALRRRDLAVQRFDRLADGTPVHSEDFAQIFGVYPEKIEKAGARSIAKVIGAEGTDDDVAECIRRLTFNTLIGNADTHLKNWSLIYCDRRRAALAPAYDFVPAIPNLPDRSAALRCSQTTRFDQFSEDELDHLASRSWLPAKPVLDTAREAVELSHQYCKSEKPLLPLGHAVADAIEKHLRTVPMAKQVTRAEQSDRHGRPVYGIAGFSDSSDVRRHRRIKFPHYSLPPPQTPAWSHKQNLSAE